MKKNMDEIWFPEELSYSPTFLIKIFNSFIHKYGKDIVFSHRKFQKTREMWIAAAFSLALTKANGIQYWISAVNSEKAPDVYVYSWKKHPSVKGATIADRVNLEITEWEEHSSENIIEDIINKKIKKGYPNYFTLLIYARRPGQVTHLESIFQQLQRIPIGISEINLLSSINGAVLDSHLAVCLYPTRLQVEFSLSEESQRNENQTGARKRLFGIGEGEPEIGQYKLTLPSLEEILSD